MSVNSIAGGAAAALSAVAPPQTRDDPRYLQVVDTLVSPDATPTQREHAYDLVAGLESADDTPLTDAVLTERAAQAIADDRTIPVAVSAVAPLVPPGTALGPFPSSDAGALEMTTYSNPLSIKANLENGGLIFRDPDSDQFFVTTPMGGTLDGFNPGQVPQPDDLTLVACYHGHADYSKADGSRTDKAGDEFNSDHFSAQDKSLADRGVWGSVIYVSTPSGDFRKYDAATRQDTVIN